MSYAGFPQPQTMNPPPPPPLGLTVMAPTGPHLSGGQYDQGPQIPMIASQGQPPLPGQPTALQHQIHQIQQMQHLMHPAMNDAQLEFNLTKNKPISVMSNLSEESKQPNSSVSDDLQAPKRLEDPRLERLREKERKDRERERDRRMDRRDRPERDRSNDIKDRTRDDSSKVGPPKMGLDMVPTTAQNSNAPPNPPGGVLPNTVQMMGVSPMLGMMGGMMGHPIVPMMGGMIGDPAMLGMPGMGQYGMMPGVLGEGTVVPSNDTNPRLNIVNPNVGGVGGGGGQKGIIECKECTLIPPSPNAPHPVTRERPPGCKTVYIGGIPENCTEEIIRDVFGRCGEMQTVRLSKKNFCHIRFMYESSVDAAIFLSGYRMRIGNSTDAPNTGRLHVDYAQARDDQYEYECKQRALQREQRHRERMERERMCPVSPPPVPHYSDHEAATVCEKIKSDEGFQKSVQTVVSWLDRGDCSKRNANTFYSMIQSTNSHVRRLMNEKMQYEEELQNAKDLFRTRVQGIIVQFGLIEKVFNCASHKKCWDHFTKAQRKNIETWKKQTLEIKQMQFGDNLNEEADEEMDVSDNEEDFNGGPRKKSRNDKDAELNVLKEENESLRCQLEAYKNEVDLVRVDLKTDIESKEKQLKVLQQTVQNLQKQLLDSKHRQGECDIKLRDFQSKNKCGVVKKQEKGDNDDAAIQFGEKEEQFVAKKDVDTPSSENTSFQLGPNSDSDAKLIGLISTFLHVHPFGAGVDYIWSFLTKLDPGIRPSDIEALLNRFPTVFKQNLSGIGATMERRWVFMGFEGV